MGEADKLAKGSEAFPGIFISFEGIEGVGKTTQINLCEAYIKSKGYDVIVTKEPGGTKFGMTIRKLILDVTTSFKSQYTEVLLFIADRLEHVEQVIKPALREGKVVLCDRYVDSTIAYQKGGRGIPDSAIDFLNGLVDLMPVCTVLLDLAPEIGLSRAKNRAELDRFEKETIDFHRRIRAGYLQQHAQDPGRVKKIDVEGLAPEEVFEKIKSVVDDYL